MGHLSHSIFVTKHKFSIRIEKCQQTWYFEIHLTHSAPSTNLMNLEKTLTGPSQGDRALLGDSEYIFVEILPIQKLKD